MNNEKSNSAKENVVSYENVILPNTKHVSPLLPAIAVSLILFFFCGGIYNLLNKYEESKIYLVTSEQLLLTSQNVKNNVDSAVIALQRMAQRWEASGGTPKREWQIDAKHYVEDFEALTTVEYVDKSYHVKWIEPIQGNEKALGLNIVFDDERKKILSNASEKNIITMTHPIDLVQGYRAFITYVPIYVQSEFNGFIVGIYNLETLFDTLLPENLKNNFNVVITDGDKEIISFGEELDDESKKTQFEVVSLFGRDWEFKVWPNQSYIKELSSILPEVSAIVGAILSILVGFSLYTSILSKRRSKLLQESEKRIGEINRRYSLILENVGDGIYGLDLKGHTTFANTAAVDLLGYSLEEMVDKSQHDLIHHSYPDGKKYKREDCNIYAAFKDGKTHTEDGEVFWRKDGTPLPVEYTSRPLSNEIGEITGAVVVFRDITERKKAEAEIEEAKAFLDLINSNNPDLIFVKDEEFKIVEANPAFLNLYPKNMQKKIIGYTTFEEYDKKDAEKFLSKDKEAFKKGYSETIEQITFPNGENRILATKKIRFENSKKEKFILAIARDVTEREELIDSLTNSNEELERFAYICSHDLQEPLRMIKGFSGLLETEIKKKFKKNEKAIDYLNFVLEGSDNAQELVRDILTYSRLDQDTDSNQEVNINDLLVEIETIMKDNIDNCGGKITYDRLPNIVGNKTQFYQLFSNLINNGIKYRREGVKPKIQIKVQSTKTYWKFTISDNGIGIKREYLEKIFEIFTRLHTKQNYSGTGIGLAICKKIVERHGGIIKVESKPDKGSKFIFTIAK